MENKINNKRKILMKNINWLLFAMFANKQLRIFKLRERQARN